MIFNINEIKNEQGRIAIVTGANSGLGFVTTKALVKKEIKVIMACRNMNKAEIARKEILDTYPNAELEIIRLDLSELSSVREFSKQFMDKYQSLDLLINNAGVMMPPFTKTKDGFELQLASNHLGHFLLTGLLIDMLISTPNARVISLSSIAHKSAKINFKDLQSEKKYSKTDAYGQSKLATLMFSLELQRRLNKKGHSTLSLAAHPGISGTDLFQHQSKVESMLFAVLKPFITHKPESAVLSVLMAAFHEPVKGGEYFGPTGFNELKGKPGKAKIAEQALDENEAKKLWEVSEKLTGLKFM